MTYPISSASAGSRLAQRDSDELQIPGLSTVVTTAIIVCVVVVPIIIAIIIGCCRRNRPQQKAGSMEMGTASPPILLQQNSSGDVVFRASESEAGLVDPKSQVVYRKTSV